MEEALPARQEGPAAGPRPNGFLGRALCEGRSLLGGAPAYGAVPVGPVSGIDGDGAVAQSRGAQDCGFELLDQVTITLEPGVEPSRSRDRPDCGVVIFSVPLLLVIFHFW